MTEDTTYDTLYKRYENAKLLLKEIRTTFTDNFQGIQGVIQLHHSQENAAFVEELSSILTTTKTSLGQLFAQTTDPGLFEATKLEQQLASFQQEKKQGIELVVNLQSSIASLQEEKRNWQIREQKGKQMIEQYQIQLENVKNGTYVNNPSIDTNPASTTSALYDENANVVQELTDELELAQTSAGSLRQMVDALTQQNKSLSNQVLHLREQNHDVQKKQIVIHNKAQNGTYTTSASVPLQSHHNVDALKQQISALLTDKKRLEEELATYKKRLSASGGNIKQLYRDGSVTEWDPADLAAMKEEMKKAMIEQHQDTLEKQFEKQFSLRMMPSTDDVTNTANNTANNEAEARTVNKEQTEDDDDGNSMKPPQYDRAFRDGTKTDWDEMELNKLKENMAAEMMEMATKEKQRAIQAMAERNDAIREPTDGSSANLIEARGFGDVNDDARVEKKEKQEREEKDEMRAQFEAMILSDKQHKIKEMAERDMFIRDESTNINVKNTIAAEEKDNEDMLAEMQRLRRDKLDAQFEKNYNLVTEATEDVVSTKVLVHDETDARAMEQTILAMKKQQLYDATDTSLNTAEPQIKPGHKNDFLSLMRNIGILNPNKLDVLWDNIESTVNGDKRGVIQMRAHSITPSQTVSEYGSSNQNLSVLTADAQQNEELNKQLRDTQETIAEQSKIIAELREEIEAMKLEEDDATILDAADDETPGGPQLESASFVNNEKLNEDMQVLKGENEKLKEENVEISEKVNEMKINIDVLNDEVQRIAKSKIEVLINTSKEIDALRQLLNDYVSLAKQQRSNKN